MICLLWGDPCYCSIFSLYLTLHVLSSPPSKTYRYTRIPHDPASRTDPFTGVYLGAFGPHGPELLQLQRIVDSDGDEAVTAVKLTGDANVPAGVTSFRAKIGRKHRQTAKEYYPEELGITARWVEGGGKGGKGVRARPGT